MNSTTLSTRRLLLLGWDAADWQHIHPLLAAGEMPALAGLVARGSWGNLATLQPMVSPMLWNSIATGKTADAHGVCGFTEPDPEQGGARPWSSLSRRCKALWNILNQTGRRSNVIGWWASHPAEPLHGTVVANTFANTRRDPDGQWHAPAGSIHPPEMAPALAPLKMLPKEVTSEHILPFIPHAAGIDQNTDRHLQSFANVLSDAVTIQSLATEIMERSPWDFMAVYWDAVDHFCHRFMPYHPPRQPHIPEQDYSIYKDVVRGAYRFHDMMLERLLQLAGPDTTVVLCSDHGFLSGAHRPLTDPNDPAGPTLWHRDMGILVMSGPGVKAGGRIYGASLLDLTPTILTLFGLPCGTDMPGKPLLDALTDRIAPDRIPSWDAVPGDDGRHPPGTLYYAPHSPAGRGSDALTEQMAALGYIEDHGADKQKAAEAAQLEADYNLAQVHLCHERPDEAVPLLERLLAVRPWESRYIHQFANALTRSGWHRQSAELLLRAYPCEGGEVPPPAVLLVLARAYIGQGEKDAAWACLARAARALPGQPGIWVETGRIAFELGRIEEAEAAFRRALEHDATFAAAWQGLSSVHLQRHQNEQALEASLEAVSHIFQLGDAHLNAGIALARLGRYAEARTAFERVTQMCPVQPHAWRFLAALPLEGENAAMLAEACRQQSHRFSRAWAIRRGGVRRRAREPRPLPEIPLPAERRARIELQRPRPEPAQKPGSSGKSFTLVSGLPRSGTSLMMQMLAAGGLPPQTDGERTPDEDNPAGYFEWEAIKRIAREPALLDAEGLDRRAIKCVTPLLQSLPVAHRYRVVFLLRPVEEIAASQARMIQRRGTTGMEGNPAAVATRLHHHRDEILSFLHDAATVFDVLTVDYPSLVTEPAPWVERLHTFLGGDLLPHPERMAAAVQPALHRVKHAARAALSDKS